MRSLCLAFCLVCVAFAWAAPAPDRAVEETDTPFWQRPAVNPQSLTPAAVQLVAAPDGARPFALLRTGDVAPSADFVPTNPRLVPLVANPDTGYRVIPAGLKAGVQPYGDRKYKVEKLDSAFSGLTLLQTKMGHKAVLDGRYAIVLSTAKPCWVFVALDERALETYKQHSAPGWLQEFAPTDRKLTTDDPIMADAEAAYRVFARKAPAGRIVLGPPCLDEDRNAMYFAFFALAQ